MFERRRIQSELRRIVGELEDSPSLPISPQVIEMIEPFLDKAVENMRSHKYDSHQAVIRLVTGLAVFGEKEGINARLKIRNPALFQDFKNLYLFSQLAYIKDPERIGDAFCVPSADGDPKPFSQSDA